MRTRLIYLLSASILAVILSGCGQSDEPAQRKPQAQQNRAHTTGAQNNTGTTAPAVAPSLASELPDSACYSGVTNAISKWFIYHGMTSTSMTADRASWRAPAAINGRLIRDYAGARYVNRLDRNIDCLGSVRCSHSSLPNVCFLLCA